MGRPGPRSGCPRRGLWQRRHKINGRSTTEPGLSAHFRTLFSPRHLVTEAFASGYAL